MHGKCTANAWQMHGKCMANAWQMHGKCMANAWQMHGKCTANASLRKRFTLKEPCDPEGQSQPGSDQWTIWAGPGKSGHGLIGL